jgi:hypothetical protein
MGWATYTMYGRLYANSSGHPGSTTDRKNSTGLATPQSHLTASLLLICNIEKMTVKEIPLIVQKIIFC